MGESISQAEAQQRLRGMDRASLEAAHVALMSERDRLRDERDQLTQAYMATKLELALMKKRLFIAKAERVDVSQLEIEFADKLAVLDALSKRLEPLPAELKPAQPPGGARAKSKPTGRRDFSEEDLPEERVEVVDPTKEGVLPRAGFETSRALRWSSESARAIFPGRTHHCRPARY